MSGLALSLFRPCPLPRSTQLGIADILETLRRRLDADAWGFLRDMSGLRNWMDAKSLGPFANQIEKEPLGLTLENVQATFSHFRENADLSFERGVVAVLGDMSI